MIIEVCDLYNKIKKIYAEVLAFKQNSIDKLNELLVIQDLDNAQKIFTRKAGKLRERLAVAENQIMQINNAGQEMDGNASNDEEDEFIDALKEEMPGVFSNIKANFVLLEAFEKDSIKLSENRNKEELLRLKKQLETISSNIVETENLANKLETEVVDWNAP